MLKNARTVAAMVVCLALAYVAGGCATFQRGPSDSELLWDLFCTYESSIKEADVDKLLTLFSPDFMDSEGLDYEQAAAHYRNVLPRFDEWGFEMSTDETEIEIDGREARIGPVGFRWTSGETVVTVLCTKEDDGIWRITGSEE
jgi:hypothetical protein